MPYDPRSSNASGVTNGNVIKHNVIACLRGNIKCSHLLPDIIGIQSILLGNTEFFITDKNPDKKMYNEHHIYRIPELLNLPSQLNFHDLLVPPCYGRKLRS